MKTKTKDSIILRVATMVALGGSVAIGVLLRDLDIFVLVNSIYFFVLTVAVSATFASSKNDNEGSTLRGQALFDQLEMEGKATRIPGTKNYHVENFAYREFSEQEKADIWSLHDQGESVVSIAALYKVTEKYIRLVLREKNGETQCPT